MKFTQTASFKQLQEKLNANNQLRAELKSNLERYSSERERSLQEITWSLANMIGQLDSKRAA